jgi:trehalose/maltose hydrolase-like predicted phosphorylase
MSRTRCSVTMGLWCGLVLAAPAQAAQPGNDGGFLLSAQQSDIPNYFPAYLGNGYLSTLTTPKGTDTSRAYLVGLMDYSAGDISRPAAVPGWTDIDFRAGDPGFSWLNRVPWREGEFSDYHQTLDMHAGTLTTTYHFREHDRETAIRVETLLSQASPHLGATRLQITPDYDGVVQLSFAFTLWSQHAPRFQMAQITGPEMDQAVAASGQSFEAHPPAAPDREAVWYPGYIQIGAADGDRDTRSLWLSGQAVRGKSMAMAGAIALPDDAQIQSVAVKRNAWRLSLDVSIQVQRGHQYDFSKFVAFSREGWGNDAAVDLQLARQARDQGFEHLLAEQRVAWDKLWQSDIEVEGDAHAQQVVHSELYQLLAAATPETGWGLGACASTPGYSGHIFWDSDTWVFPALLLLHPERAKSLVTFRERGLPAAQQRARQHGFDGAMYPWEADPENGSEQTPHSAFALSETEIHVTAEIAVAQWQYYLATHDREWLRQHGWPVIREVARFWASRVTYDAASHRYHLEHVNSVAESQPDVRNDTFTNLFARKALQIATAAAKASGERADPSWERIAHALYVPMDEQAHHYLPFDPSIVVQSKDFGGGPLALLFLPALDLQMTPQLLKGNYDFAVRPTPLARAGSFSMGLPPHTIAAAAIGDESEATRWLDSNYSGGTLKPPFNVRTETASNNTGYFITGSAGYLQSLLYGFSGLRIREQGLVEAYPPVLPATWSALTLRNIQIGGQHLDIRIERDASGRVHLTRRPH